LSTLSYTAILSERNQVGRTLPDLAGLSVREAIRELSARGVLPKIVGKGVVVAQSPVPGARLPLAGPCVLRCEPRLAPGILAAVARRGATPAAGTTAPGGPTP